MTRLTCCFPAILLAIGACAADKLQEKGAIDDSLPPTDPPIADTGKADDLSRLLPLELESAHPYANDMNEEFVIELGSVVPRCAFRVRLRFSALQLESGYDFLHVVDSNGQIVESLTGNHDGAMSEWMELRDDTRQVSLVLETDFSVVRHGFVIDAVEWEGAPICPAFVPSCPAGQVDINEAPGACECPALPTCVDAADVTASHSTGGGFAGTFTGTRLEGTRAVAFTHSVTTGNSESVLGTVDADAVERFVADTGRSGVLWAPSVSEPDNFAETFAVAAGGASIEHVRRAGSYPAPEAAAIAQFDALFVCGAGQPLTCADDRTCVDGQCVEAAGCVCPEIFQPVCGANNFTYGNACEAACAGVDVRHEGECGIAGDMCGGFAGFVCQPDHKCRFGEGQFEFPFPDAAGQCVAADYCDSAADCAGLPHIAVPGSWACNANQCSWDQGSPWLPIAGWSMESAHPYGNDESVWKQLYAPAGAASVRIEIESFALESGYDVLDVWTWNGQRWFRSLRLTGDEPAGATYELGGRYHYVHFASDFSVTRDGFAIAASYSFEEI